jgi:predicted DCC family thiol-disulfide oxidoreductase YuxK
MESKPRWKMFYDGGCNLCHTTQLRTERWAAAHGQPLEVDLLQSAEAIGKGYTMEGFVLEVDGKAHIGYDAWLEMLKVAPLPLRWIHWIRKVPPVRWITKLGYGIVAKYRLKWFGSRECTIPQR